MTNRLVLLVLASLFLYSCNAPTPPQVPSTSKVIDEKLQEQAAADQKKLEAEQGPIPTPPPDPPDDVPPPIHTDRLVFAHGGGSKSVTYDTETDHDNWSDYSLRGKLVLQVNMNNLLYVIPDQGEAQ